VEGKHCDTEELEKMAKIARKEEAWSSTDYIKGT